MVLTVTLNPAVDYTVFGNVFQVGTTNRCEDIPPDPGGKGNNAARIARLLGAEVIATGILGGFTGDFIEGQLREEGIVPDFYRRTDQTRITVSFVDKDTLDQTKIVPSGHPVSKEDTNNFLMHYENLLKRRNISIVSLNGSLLSGQPDTLYARLIEIGNKFNIPVILDSSGIALQKGIEAGPVMIKPNIEEAAEYFGTREWDHLVAGCTALSGKIKVVALTLGGQGALFFQEPENIWLRVPKINAVNPVGAGDAFIGGFLVSFDKTGVIDEETYKWAVGAATCTASVPGMIWERTMFDTIINTIEITNARMFRV